MYNHVVCIFTSTLLSVCTCLCVKALMVIILQLSDSQKVVSNLLESCNWDLNGFQPVKWSFFPLSSCPIQYSKIFRWTMHSVSVAYKHQGAPYLFTYLFPSHFSASVCAHPHRKASHHFSFYSHSFILFSRICIPNASMGLLQSRKCPLGRYFWWKYDCK